MSQNIQLQQVSINGMVVKMGGDKSTAGIVRRVLDRGKFLYFLSHWEYNNSARMLSGASPDTGTPLYNTVDLARTLVLSPLFKIVLYISECGFIRKGTDGSRLEGLTFSEYNLCIMMGIGLILS